MKRITIIQSSLREKSNTSIVCREFEKRALAKWLEINYIDLRDLEMEFCTGKPLDEYTQDLQDTYTSMEDSQAVVFGMPVYQYSMSWVLKNFIDICGGAIKWKQVGTIVNAGWPNCYMASSDLFNALFYEYGCVGIMPTPYTWSMDFKDGSISNEKVLSKLDELADKIISL